MFYKKSELENVMLFKVETVARYQSFMDLSDSLQELWRDRYASKYTSLSVVDSFERYSHFIPEFNTISAIHFGIIDNQKGVLSYEIASFDIGKEKDIIGSFGDALAKNTTLILGGYNVTNYQIPMLIKKMMNHGVKLPFQLMLRNKKPWDIVVLDLMRDYQGNMFGDLDINVMAEQFGLNKTAVNAYDELELTLNLIIKLST